MTNECDKWTDTLTAVGQAGWRTDTDTGTDTDRPETTRTNTINTHTHTHMSSERQSWQTFSLEMTIENETTSLPQRCGGAQVGLAVLVKFFG